MSPQLTQNLSHEGEWQCCICAEHHNATPPSPWTDSATQGLVCEDCIRREFEQALKFDHHMPAGWGRDEWEISDYAYAILDADFVLAYSISWFRKMARLATEASQPRNAQALADEMPKGWELGRQYQRCPVCLEPAQLLEACNHMTCGKPCKTDYCYICGNEVSREELHSHWAKGGCPRWNHPDDANASFDEGGDDDGEEEDMESDPGMEDYDQDDTDDGSDVDFDLPAFIEYAWNMAMQNGDRHTRRLMANVLTRGDEHFHVNIENLINTVFALSAISRYNRSSGVSHAEWSEILRRHRDEAHVFLAKPASQGGLSHTRVLPGSPGLPISCGVLNGRVGGVFNFSTMAGRAQAYSWATSRGIAWNMQRTREGDRENYAVFHLGPGGTLRERRDASWLLERLALNGNQATFGRVIFVNISRYGQTVLVEITPRIDFGPGSEEPGEDMHPLRRVRDWMFRVDPVPEAPPFARSLLFATATGVF